jgi:cbb3-type cytochrome oxidase subunit 1
MDTFVRRFIRSSLLWLGVGVALGLAMALDARLVGFRQAHMHANLLGFVSMMIFGVAYHVFPRFTGRPLFSRRMAEVHLWLANSGLAGMVSGFILRLYRWQPGMVLLSAGAALSAAGALCFILNIWRTLDAAPARPPVPVSLTPRDR